jgi:Flp pilus assembly protein TadD
LEARPGHVHAVLGLTRLEMRAGRPLVATGLLRAALAAKPDNLPVGVAMTRVLAIQGRSEEAREVLERLRVGHSDDPELSALEGWLALRAGNPQQAVAALRAARAKAPAESRALMLDLVRAQWHGGDREGALATLEAWVDAHPEDDDARLALAGKAMQVGRRDRARADFEQILKRSPAHVLALNDLAWLLVDEDPEQALAYAVQVYCGCFDRYPKRCGMRFHRSSRRSWYRRRCTGDRGRGSRTRNPRQQR